MYTKDNHLNDIIIHNYKASSKLIPKRAKEHLAFAETVKFLSDDNLSYSDKKKRVDNIFKNSRLLNKHKNNKELADVVINNNASIEGIMFMKKYNNKQGKNLFGKKIKKQQIQKKRMK